MKLRVLRFVYSHPQSRPFPVQSSNAGMQAYFNRRARLKPSWKNADWINP